MTPEASKALAEAGPWAVVIFIGGLIAIAGARVILVLWRSHLEADAEDRRQRDDNFALARDAVAGTNRLAAVQEAREKRDAKSSRKTDP